MPPSIRRKPFPDAVAEHEAGIEDRDDRLLARQQRAVDGDQDAGVARIVGVFVRAGAHRADRL